MRRIEFDFATQTGDAQVNSSIERLHLAVGRHLQQLGRVAVVDWGFRRAP